jgi:hypothetical protein
LPSGVDFINRFVQKKSQRVVTGAKRWYSDSPTFLLKFHYIFNFKATAFALSIPLWCIFCAVLLPSKESKFIRAYATLLLQQNVGENDTEWEHACQGWSSLFFWAASEYIKCR